MMALCVDVLRIDGQTKTGKDMYGKRLSGRKA